MQCCAALQERTRLEALGKKIEEDRTFWTQEQGSNLKYKDQLTTEEARLRQIAEQVGVGEGINLTHSWSLTRLAVPPTMDIVAC